MQKPQVGLLHIDKIDKSFFEDFISEVNESNLNFIVEGRPEPGPFACAEWLIPTAIVAFVSKTYFEEFLKEMGKDHYQSLKRSLGKLCKKTMETPRFEPVLIGTEGKVLQSNPYTMTFSIIAEAGDGYNFKLLLPKYDEGFDYQIAADIFMEFIADFHRLGTNSRAFEIIQTSNVPGGTVLVRLNPKTNKIEWQDHIPPEAREKMRKTKE